MATINRYLDGYGWFGECDCCGDRDVELRKVIPYLSRNSYWICFYCHEEDIQL